MAKKKRLVLKASKRASVQVKAKNPSKGVDPRSFVYSKGDLIMLDEGK